MNRAVALTLCVLVVVAQVASGACLCVHPEGDHQHSHPAVAHEHEGHHHHHGAPAPQAPPCPDDDPCKCSPPQPFTVPEVAAAVAQAHDAGAPLFLHDAWLAPTAADLVARAGWAHRPRPPPDVGGICSHAPSNLPELLL